MDDSAVGTEPIVLVAIGGAPDAARLPELPPAGSVVVAADAGLHLLHAAGLRADHLVGDLDSVHPVELALAEGDGARVHRHPADKDATDLELALDLVVDLIAPATGIRRLVIVGGGGGRLDHLLADVLLLAAARLAHFAITAHLGAATVGFARPDRPVAIVGGAGEQVSLLPVHGAVDGVTTTGLRWPLVAGHLAAGSTRAMSNELLAATATVTVVAGVLAVVQPGTVAPPIAPRGTPYDPTPTAPVVDTTTQEERP